MAQDVQEVVSLLRRVVSALKEVSVRVNEASYNLSTVVGMLESMKLQAPKEAGVAERKAEEAAPPKTVAVEAPPVKAAEAVESATAAQEAVKAAGEEHLVKVSERIHKPVEERFKKLEALVEDGTKLKELSEELLSLKSWIYEEYPSFMPIVYHIDMWSRKLKSYGSPALLPNDKSRLMFSLAEWKERMMKAK